ncbi:MAG: ADOP family duplicated permease [Bryobacteraceae bacterium]
MRLWKRLCHLVHRGRLQRELEEEVRIHREMTRENLRRSGVSSEDAGYAAERALGNATLALEDSRAEWSFGWLESLARDVHYAVRGFFRRPAFAATVIGTIGLALGLNTALFTAFNAYVLRPFAVHDPYSLYQFAWHSKTEGHGLTWRDFQEIRGGNTVFSEVFAWQFAPVRAGRQTYFINLVSGNYFTMLGVDTVRGRPILQSDTATPGAGAVLVLDYTAWQTKFGGDPDIIGRKLVLRGHPFEIIGVVRPEFAGLSSVPTDFWAPLTISGELVDGPDLFGPRQPEQLQTVGRLKPGVTEPQAQGALTVWFRQKTMDRPEGSRSTGVLLDSRATSIPLTRQTMGVFAPVFAGFALVLLIACANVANMMLARAAARQREIEIRLSLGAGRSRLVRQLVTESLLLALPAAAAGFAIAEATIHLALYVMSRMLPPDYAAMLHVASLAPDMRVFGYILLLAGLAALVFGLAPALQATRPDVASAGDRRGHPARLRNTLVIVQVAVCAVLLICAGVLLRGGQKMEARDVGLDMRGVFNVQVLEAMRAKVVERLERDPAVEAIAAAWRPPLAGSQRQIFMTPGGSTSSVPAGYNFVSPEYFTVFRIRIDRGRNFTAQEARAGAAVAIISGATARRFWPRQDALGQSIRIDADPAAANRYRKLPAFRMARVVGIAKDVVSGILVNDVDSTCVYFPVSPRAADSGALLVRFKTDTDTGGRLLNAALAGVAPDAAGQVISMRDELGLALLPFRLASWTSGLLGGVALLLTLSGIYGVLSYLVGQRTREIGIRMALGATTASVVRIVFRQSMRLAVLGLAAGVILALGASRVLASVFFMMNTFDALAYAAGALAVIAAAAGAAYFPSRQAAQVDPAITLRYD